MTGPSCVEWIWKPCIKVAFGGRRFDGWPPQICIRRMYDIADLWTPRFMKSRGLSNRNWISDPQDGCHAGEAGCCRMMLASAVLGKSMLGGGLLSHLFTRRILPFRSIPAQPLVGTLNG